VVVVPAGKTVVLDGATPPLRGLVVRGTLVAGDADIAITTDALYVDGGRLQIGSAQQPFQRNATITLTGSTAGDHPNTPGFGNKVLAQMGGVVELHGRPVARSWTALNADAAAGSRTLVLAEAPGWRAGDQIVVSTSSRDQLQYSTGEIERIDGSAVTLKAPLRYAHRGTKTTITDGVVIDTRAHVGLLNRNIVIQGDAGSATSRIGGHAMFMNAPTGTTTVQIAGVEFRAMGQFDRLGRYPVHFHLMGTGCGSCYVRDSSIRDSVQRGIVVHDSAVTVKGNVVFNTVGHNVVVETATTEGAVIDGNLALVNHLPNPLFADPGLVVQNDLQPSNFWIRSSRNTIVNNVAGGALDSGLMVDHAENGPTVLKNNIAYAAMSRGVESTFPTTGAHMLIFARDGMPGDAISELTAYNSAIGVWLEIYDEEAIGPNHTIRPLVGDKLAMMNNDVGLFSRGSGNKLVLNDAVFVRNPTRNQYGGNQVLNRPVFANLPGSVGGAHDAGPEHSRFYISQARMVNSPQWVPDDSSFMVFADDSMFPRGMYIPAVQPWLATPECARVTFTNAAAGDTESYWRCPRMYGYTEIDVRDLAAPGVRLHQSRNVRRSDGLTWRVAGTNSPLEGMGGRSGYAAFYDAGLGYGVVDAAAAGYAVRLSQNDDAVVYNEQATIEFSVPLASAPSGVFRHGTSEDAPDAPSAAHALRAVGSRAELAANPLATYFYDATNRQVVFHASKRWVTVRP
jgi:hypothetical protein